MSSKSSTFKHFRTFPPSDANIQPTHIKAQEPIRRYKTPRIILRPPLITLLSRKISKILPILHIPPSHKTQQAQAVPVVSWAWIDVWIGYAELPSPILQLEPRISPI